MKRKIFSYQQCLELFEKYYGNNWNPISSFPFSVFRITTFNIWHMYAAVTQKDVSYLAFIDILLFPLNIVFDNLNISSLSFSEIYYIYMCFINNFFLENIFSFSGKYTILKSHKRGYTLNRNCAKKQIHWVGLFSFNNFCNKYFWFLWIEFRSSSVAFHSKENWLLAKNSHFYRTTSIVWQRI